MCKAFDIIKENVPTAYYKLIIYTLSFYIYFNGQIILFFPWHNIKLSYTIVAKKGLHSAWIQSAKGTGRQGLTKMVNCP